MTPGTRQPLPPAPPAAAPAAPRRPRTLPDLLLGALGGGMVLLALLVAVLGGPDDTGGRPAPSAPPLQILQPQDGAVVQGRVVLSFRPSAPLRLTQNGWGTDTLHLHMAVDTRDLMPAPGDVRAAGEPGVYQWTMPPLPAGMRTLQLFWAGPGHRRINAGASRPVSVELRPAPQR